MIPIVSRILLTGFFLFLCLSIIIPIMLVVVTAVTPDDIIIRYGYVLVPKAKPDFTSFGRILRSIYLESFTKTIILSAVGTVFSMFIITMGGFTLSHTELPGRKIFMYMIIIGLIFDGGIIPWYLVIKGLGLLDTWAALIIPVAVSHFILILMKNYMVSIPRSLPESARIDGANDFTILFRIVIPVSLPIIAACTLFYFIQYWNRYLEVVMLINDTKKYTLQVHLRQLLFEANSEDFSSDNLYNNFKMSVMLMGMIPVLILYPFIQKHFVKGLLLGSIKG